MTRFFTSLSTFFDIYGDMFVSSIQKHLFYVLVSVSIGFVLGLFFGILLSRAPQLSAITLPLISVFQTIPGIVFIGILFLYTGMEPITVLIALSIYAMFPVLKNTYTGLLGVEKQYLEAAMGCGMTKFQSLFQVELPMAFPVVFTGIRIATVNSISTAVFATFVGGGGIGSVIYRGIRIQNMGMILSGTAALMIMAIFFDTLMGWIERRMMAKNGLTPSR